MKVEEKVKNIVMDILGVSESELEFDKALRADLGATSVDLVEIVAEIENQFDIDIDDEDSEKLMTMSDIVSYLKEKVGE